MGDEEGRGEDEEEAAEGVEEEDVETPHGLKHGLEEEGDKEPQDATNQDGEGNHLTPGTRRRRRRKRKRRR